MIKGGLYMWYKAESSELPSTIDDTSSRVYVYVRKNINVEQRTDESGEIITVYVYDEIKIPKEVYEIFKLESGNERRISDIEDVLADMLFGG